jgi:hypothetical protein
MVPRRSGAVALEEAQDGRAILLWNAADGPEARVRFLSGSSHATVPVKTAGSP